LQADQLLRERSHPIDVIACPTKFHPQVAAIGPTQARERLRERRDDSLRRGIVFVAPHEHADAPHSVALLRARRERPSGDRAAERSDEFAPSKANPHLALLCEARAREPDRGRIARQKPWVLPSGGEARPGLRLDRPAWAEARWRCAPS
jgi:hypothetical protein